MFCLNQIFCLRRNNKRNVVQQNSIEKFSVNDRQEICEIMKIFNIFKKPDANYLDFDDFKRVMYSFNFYIRESELKILLDGIVINGKNNLKKKI